MSLKEAVASFNLAVDKVIREEPSLAKAHDTEALADGNTATTLRATVTKNDCKLGSVVNYGLGKVVANYPDATNLYAETIGFCKWLREKLTPFGARGKPGSTLRVSKANTSMEMAVGMQFGVIGRSIVFGTVETEAAKNYTGSNPPLVVVNLETKEVWMRDNTSSSWAKQPVTYDWRQQVEPNSWYTDQANRKLVYIGSDYSYLLF